MSHPTPSDTVPYQPSWDGEDPYGQQKQLLQERIGEVRSQIRKVEKRLTSSEVPVEDNPVPMDTKQWGRVRVDEFNRRRRREREPLLRRERHLLGLWLERLLADLRSGLFRSKSYRLPSFSACRSLTPEEWDRRYPLSRATSHQVERRRLGKGNPIGRRLSLPYGPRIDRRAPLHPEVAGVIQQPSARVRMSGRPVPIVLQDNETIHHAAERIAERLRIWARNLVGDRGMTFAEVSRYIGWVEPKLGTIQAKALDAVGGQWVTAHLDISFHRLRSKDPAMVFVGGEWAYSRRDSYGVLTIKFNVETTVQTFLDTLSSTEGVSELGTILRHELTHAVQITKNPQVSFPMGNKPSFNDDPEGYFNLPAEVEAYIGQITQEALDLWHRRSTGQGVSDFMRGLWDRFDRWATAPLSYMTPENRKRVWQAVYRALTEEAEKDKTKAPLQKAFSGRVKSYTGQRANSTVLDNPAFRAWFGDSKVVNPDGSPKVVYHATTHLFSEFSVRKTHPDNFFGRALYFTDGPQDLENYLGMGPDLKNRVEQEADRIMETLGEDERAPYGSDEYKKQYEKALEKAKRKLVGPVPSGVAMPCYLRIENPLYLKKGERFPLDLYYVEDAEGNIVGERGKGVRFLRHLQSLCKKYHIPARDLDLVLSKVYEAMLDGVTTVELDKILRNDEAIASMEDRYGNYVGYEALKELYRRSGFDGIIMDAESYFGGGRPYGTPMPGTEGVTHYIVFDPRQVKSAIANVGTYDPTKKDIRASLDQEDFEVTGSVRKWYWWDWEGDWPDNFWLFPDGKVAVVEGFGWHETALEQMLRSGEVSPEESRLAIGVRRTLSSNPSYLLLGPPQITEKQRRLLKDWRDSLPPHARVEGAPQYGIDF